MLDGGIAEKTTHGTDGHTLYREIFPGSTLKVPVESADDWNGNTLAATGRMDDYGHPVHNFRRIAGIWSAILDVPITPEDVALMMIGLKIAREKAKHKPDNLDDIDGYVDCLRLLVSHRKTVSEGNSNA